MFKWLIYPLGSDFFCVNNKFLVYNLVSRNLKLKYRMSYLGVLWTLIVPAATALVYYVVFQHVIKIQIENYLFFLLLGTLTWNFFASCVSQGMESVVSNQGLLNKTQIPLQVFPLSETLTLLINYIFSTPIILLVALLMDANLTSSLFQFPILLFFLALQAYSFATLLSLLYVYFRDFKHLISIVLQIWFYLTPVIYKADMIPEKYRPLLWANPVGHIIKGIQDVVIFGQTQSIPELAGSAAWTLLVFLVAATVYKHLHKTVVEYL